MRHNRTLAKRVCKKIVVAYMNGEDKTKRKLLNHSLH